MEMKTNTELALEAVASERMRQESMKQAGRFAHTCADPEPTDAEKLAILVEEVGEVARALLEKNGNVNDKTGAELRKELVQVAAIATAWVESIDEAAKPRPKKEGKNRT